MSSNSGDADGVDGRLRASGRAANRIDDVLSDLGGQWEAAEAAELAAEVEDRTRREAALLRVVDRLRASTGMALSIATMQGTVSGRLAEVGSDWLRLDIATGHAAVLPLTAVVAVSGLSWSAVAASTVGPLAERLDLRHVLRGVVRDRASVRLVVSDGTVHRGVLSQCGADFVELTVRTENEGGTGTRRWLVPLRAVIAVHLG